MIQSNSVLMFSVDGVNIMNFEAEMLVNLFKKILTPEN